MEGRQIRPTTVLLIIGSGILPQVANQLGQDFGWYFTLPLAAVGLVAGAWAALRTRHADAVSRWGFLCIAALYVVLLVSLAWIPNVPMIWVVIPPVALWAVAVQLLIGLPWYAGSRLQSGLLSLFGVGMLGFGVAMVSAGVALLVDQEWVLGVTGVAGGVAVLVGGLEQLLLRTDGMDRSATVLGCLLLLAAVASVLTENLWLGAVLGCVGLIFIGWSLAERTAPRVGVAVAMWAGALFLFLVGFGALLNDHWRGVPALGVGASLVLGGVALLRHHVLTARLAMAGVSLSFLGVGVTELVLGGIAFGVSMSGIGIIGLLAAVVDPAPLTASRGPDSPSRRVP